MDSIIMFVEDDSKSKMLLTELLIEDITRERKEHFLDTALKLGTYKMFIRPPRNGKTIVPDWIHQGKALYEAHFQNYTTGGSHDPSIGISNLHLYRRQISYLRGGYEILDTDEFSLLQCACCFTIEMFDRILLKSQVFESRAVIKAWIGIMIELRQLYKELDVLVCELKELKGKKNRHKRNKANARISEMRAKEQEILWSRCMKEDMHCYSRTDSERVKNVMKAVGASRERSCDVYNHHTDTTCRGPKSRK